MQRIFGPSMAVAWLLVSPLSPEHGERLLRRIISEDDLDVALAAGGSPEDVSHASEAVLQGLASLEVRKLSLLQIFVYGHGPCRWLQRTSARFVDNSRAFRGGEQIKTPPSRASRRLWATRVEIAPSDLELSAIHSIAPS